MKKLVIGLLSLCLSGSFVACNTQADKTNETKEISVKSLTEIKFKKLEHNFGEITEGEIVSFTYKYKNVGKTNYIITSARASCGCTLPKWSKEPLAPGKEGEIEVQFDSSRRSGVQHKTVTIYGNTKEKVIKLRFSAKISESKNDKS